MVSLQSLRDLFVEELKDIYNAEQQLLKALPKMRKGVTNPRLANAFEQHLEQTRNHAERLERILEDLQESPRGRKCKGMEGLVEEGKEMLDLRGGDAARDAAIIGAAQRVEHYEIAAYGTACAHARATGNTMAEQLLQQTLEEEKETDRLLTEIAEGGINDWASEEEFSGAGQIGNGGGFGNGRSMGGSRRTNGRTNGRTTARSTSRSAARRASGGGGGAKRRKTGRSSTARSSTRSTRRTGNRSR
ncbi:MAG TPA: ferritin-like domain-containing protein [Gemmatimonadaceae bacterium]|nr:ferritin-like domain-containing protein [Gemmatimonadaceae bacterium]